jgi:outer membrane protein OmpA-like peptidoglycan-associated protein
MFPSFFPKKSPSVLYTTFFPMKKNPLLWMAVCLVLTSTVWGQKRPAQILFDRKGYQASLDANKRLLETDRDKDGMTQDVPLPQAVQLAESYRLSGDYASAAQWYATIVDRSDKPEFLLRYAECLQAIGDCGKAGRLFLRYDALMMADTTQPEGRVDRRGYHQAQACANGISTQANVVVTNAPFNTDRLDFSPVPVTGGLVFVSNRPNDQKTYRKRVDAWTNEDFNDLWFVPIDNSGGWGEAEPFSGRLNSRLHEGPATFNGGKDVVYFTRNLLFKGKQSRDKNGTTSLGIYTARYVDGTWTNLQPFPFNNENKIYCHPTLSADGRFLYFASDRPGGFGGLDIWVSEFKNGRWAKPTNLGAEVNTAGNENFPFVHADGNLYFSSNGWGGAGGMDIFRAQPIVFEDSTAWTPAQNLGKPFNSSVDDFSFSANADYTAGYFTSNREGGRGQDDIYLFKTPEGLKPTPPAVIIESNLFVFDQTTDARLAGAVVTVSTKKPGQPGSGLDQVVALRPVEGSPNMYYLTTTAMGGPNAGSGAGNSFTTDENGQVGFQMVPNQTYYFTATKDGYQIAESQYSTMGINQSRKIEHGIPMVALPQPNCTKIQGTVVNGTYNKQPMPGAKVVLFNRCTGERLELISDAFGRVELCVSCKCDYDVMAEKDGFAPATAFLSYLKDCPKDKENVELSLTISDKTAVGGLTPSKFRDETIKEGAVVELVNVFYDYDQASIRPDASLDLERLAALMQRYPEMEIEMLSHTDCRGSDAYNQRLSQARAQSVVDFLVSKGVAAYRLSAKGYGETRLRNGCRDNVNCSEADHQYNRRTEFMVRKFPYQDIQVRYLDKSTR